MEVTAGRSRALLALAVCVGVAAVSAGSRLVVHPADAGAAWLKGARMLGILSILGGMGLFALQRKRWDPGVGTPDRIPAALRDAGAIMLVLAFLGVLVRPDAPPRPDPDTASGAYPVLPEQEGGDGDTPATTRGGGSSGIRGTPRPRSTVPAPELEELQVEVGRRDGLQRFGRYLPLAILLGLALLVRHALARGNDRPDEEPLPDSPIRPDESERILVDALEALGAPALAEARPQDADPVTAAYHRMLGALADTGLPRLPHEAPHEHLHRALVPAGVQPGPLHRLAELYGVAQFSERPLTVHDHREAADALARSLAELRARRVG